MQYCNFVGQPKIKTDVVGAFFDFNCGPRILLPEGEYDIILKDLDNCNKYEKHILGGNVVFFDVPQDYIRWHIVVSQNDKFLWEHTYDANNKNIHIDFVDGGKALGGVIYAMACVENFRKQHHCHIYVTIQNIFVNILKRSYPEIIFLSDENDDLSKIYAQLPADIYATYCMRGFAVMQKPYGTYNILPVDWRIEGLPRYYCAKLNIGLIENPVNKLLPSEKELHHRTITEPYVCISGRGSTIFKEWNNENGWAEVTKYLRQLGYRVLCIDGDGIEKGSPLDKALTVGLENFTGYRSLQERIDLLYHADFFIGISSGLSWLAWGMGKSVILISGFTLPFTEFYTPYRVINYIGCPCCGCHNDINAWAFDNGLYELYPCQNTEYFLSCSLCISSTIVCSNIDKLMVDNDLSIPEVKKELQ